MLFIAMYSLMKNSLTNIHSSIVQTPKRWESIKGPCREARMQLRAVWVVFSGSSSLKGAFGSTNCDTMSYDHMAYDSQNISFVAWTWRLEWSLCLIHSYVRWLALVKGSAQHSGQETERECQWFLLPPFQNTIFHQPRRCCCLRSGEHSTSR